MNRSFSFYFFYKIYLIKLYAPIFICISSLIKSINQSILYNIYLYYMKIKINENEKISFYSLFFFLLDHNRRFVLSLSLFFIYFFSFKLFIYLLFWSSLLFLYGCILILSDYKYKQKQINWILIINIYVYKLYVVKERKIRINMKMNEKL